MLLTTKDNIKKFLGITSNNEDVILSSIATAVSKQIEKHLLRGVHIEERTQYFDVEEGQKVFQLDAYPVTPITACAVYNDYSRAFQTAIDPGNYTVFGSTGELIIDQYSLTTGFRVLKAVYTGGMAATQQALEENYPDIEMATRIQGAFLYTKKDKLGISGETIAGGGQIQYQKIELLPTVKEILQPYRNVQYV